MLANWQLLAVPLLILFCGLVVAAEYAFVAVRQVQIDALRTKGWVRVAAALDFLKERPARTIAAIQILITVGSLLLGWLGEPVLHHLLQQAIGGFVDVSTGPWRVASTVFAIAVVTWLTVVFSELLPKAVTLRYVSTVAIVTAIPTALVLRLTTPFVSLMNATANLVTRPLGLGRIEEMESANVNSHDEIRLMASEAADEGVLSTQERSLILNTLSLGRRKAKQIMVPRVRVAYLDLQRSMDDNRAVMNQHLYSRLPLCDGGMDNVVGVVPTKEFLSAYNAEGDSSVLGLIARPAVFAPESISLDHLLILFDQKKTQLAFLVDEHGGVEGIVTLRDVVDELVGEPLSTPADPASAASTPEGQEPAPPRRPARLLLEGDTPLHSVREMLELPEWAADETVITIGGLVSAHLGRIPRPGDETSLGTVRVRVLEADQRVVRKVSVSVIDPAEPAQSPRAPSA